MLYKSFYLITMKPICSPHFRSSLASIKKYKQRENMQFWQVYCLWTFVGNTKQHQIIHYELNHRLKNKNKIAHRNGYYSDVRLFWSKSISVMLKTVSRFHECLSPICPPTSGNKDKHVFSEQLNSKQQDMYGKKGN